MGRRLLPVALLLLATLPAAAVDTPPSDALPDLSPIRAKIAANDLDGAASDLTALARSVKHADVYNLLGFTFRKLKRFDEAGRWYQQALYYDPSHRAALEYQGELFLETGDLEAAKGNLLQLKFLCPDGCGEFEALRAAILRTAGPDPDKRSDEVSRW